VKSTLYRRTFSTKNRQDGEWINKRRIDGY
jgi:hypothetical protein